jgi:hypothetical protein
LNNNNTALYVGLIVAAAHKTVGTEDNRGSTVSFEFLKFLVILLAVIEVQAMSGIRGMPIYLWHAPRMGRSPVREVKPTSQRQHWKHEVKNTEECV